MPAEPTSSPSFPFSWSSLSACAVHAGRGVPAPGRPHAGRLVRHHRRLGGRLTRRIALWDQNAVGFGVIVTVDNFSVFFNVTICAIGILTILLSSGTAERDHLPLGEYYTLMLFSIAGMMLMGSTQRPARHLHRARDHVARRVRADRHQAIERGGCRSGVQVLRARRVLERVLPLRHRARLRGHRHDEARRTRPCASPLGARAEHPRRSCRWCC